MTASLSGVLQNDLIQFLLDGEPLTAAQAVAAVIEGISRAFKWW